MENIVLSPEQEEILNQREAEDNESFVINEAYLNNDELNNDELNNEDLELREELKKAYYQKRDNSMPKNDKGYVVKFNEYKQENSKFSIAAAKLFDKAMKDLIDNKLLSKSMINIITTERNRFITQNLPLIPINKKTGEARNFNEMLDMQAFMLKTSLHGRYYNGEKYKMGIVDRIANLLKNSKSYMNTKELEEMKSNLEKQLEKVHKMIERNDFSEYKDPDEAKKHETNIVKKMEQVKINLENYSNYETPDVLKELKAETEKNNELKEEKETSSISFKHRNRH